MIINAWHEFKNWESKDKHIVSWKNQKIKWIPKWIDKISLKPFSLNFVYGPKQVGKTTGIKLLIKKLIDSGVEREKIVYIDVELYTSLKSFRDELMKLSKEVRYIFLDEVTKLPGWDRMVKGLIDLGVFSNHVITVTGSSSVNLLKHADAFPGRKGYGKKVEVLPLNFKEFVEVHGVKVASIYGSKIRELFEKYKGVGGFPSSINEVYGFYEDFISSFKAEISSSGKSVNKVSEVISALLKMIPSALSYNAIATKTSLSRPSVEEYIEILEDLFLIKIAYYKDFSNRVNFRKEKKIIFRDPFILNSFSTWTNTKYLESALYENIVQEHLYRKYGEIYYYKNKYEIDCIASKVKVEVKAGKPHRRYPKGVKVLDEEEIPFFLLELSS